MAIPPNCTPKKQNKPQQQQQQQNKQQQNKQQQNKQQQQQPGPGPGPFGKANRKLEQMQRLASKKQKSKQAQANKKQRKQLNAAPVDFVDLAESCNSESSDDVVLVPLPPVPIIDLDASDNEQPSTSSAAQVYHEENAMDAADVRMSLSCITEPEVTAPTGIVTPSMHSPCSSVMSSDDFIVQKDTSRLQADREKANDDDLVVLTENAIREAGDQQEMQTALVEEEAAADPETPQGQDTSSEYEFVPPSRLDEIKQNYRVDDEQQFRALDVYESESDLTESGIYSKAKSKVTPTIIRSVDSPSDSSPSVEEVVAPSVQKTKRLRKRSCSTNNHSHSESANNEDGENDSDSEDGVQATGVPGIARGMAVERCKRKIRRLSTRRSSEENPRKAARIQKPRLSASQEASSESAVEEDVLPSARDIAERLLKQEQGLVAREQPSVSSDVLDTVSIGSDADSQGEAEFRDAMTDRIAAVFDRIDAQSRKPFDQEQDASGYISDEEEADSTLEESMEAANELQGADPEVVDEQQIQVEHNLPGITDESLPNGGELIGWNEEMRRFYDDSWNGEHFSVHKLQRSMSGEYLIC